MATKAQTMGGGTGVGGLTQGSGISSRRGVSAKGRKESMKQAQEALSQTPVKENP
jgi:hypothetical protein